MKSEQYNRFKNTWNTDESAKAYKEERFSRSKRWLRIDIQEQEIVSEFVSGISAKSLVLDIPCGAGRFYPLFMEADMRYVGADISVPMLELFQSSFKEATLVKADALNLPFEEKTFDALISVRLFHRIHEHKVRTEMLREMSRVTKGQMLVTYYTRWNLRGIQRWLRGKYPGISLSEVHRDAFEAGLRITSAIPLNRWTQQQWFFCMERI